MIVYNILLFLTVVVSEFPYTPASQRPPEAGDGLTRGSAITRLEEKHMRMHKALIASAVLAFAAVFGISQAQEMKFFKIASGSAGGTYFPMAGIIANAVSNPPGSRPCEKRGSCGVPGLVAIAMSANGSVANVNSIQSGAVESGFVQSDVTYWAYTGTGVFEGKPAMKKLRVIANLYPEHIHVVVRKDSPYKKITDLKGKKIGIGLQASGAKVGAVLILEAHGMKENVAYQAEYLNSKQSSIACATTSSTP